MSENRHVAKDVWPTILRLVNGADDIETVRWLMWVDECFDGGDFDIEEFGNLRWRLDVLKGKLPEVDWVALVRACQRVLDDDRTRHINGGFCGNLWTNAKPTGDPAHPELAAAA